LRPKLAANPARDSLTVTAATAGGGGGRIIAQALAAKRVVATASGTPGSPVSLTLPRPRLWTPSSPYLYGLRIRLVSGGHTIDDVRSYFGMRTISLGRVGGATRILLNGRFVF